jgi:hypothetical protein
MEPNVSPESSSRLHFFNFVLTRVDFVISDNFSSLRSQPVEKVLQERLKNISIPKSLWMKILRGTKKIPLDTPNVIQSTSS